MLNTVIFYSAREDFRSEELDIILKTMRLNMVMQNSADRQDFLIKLDMKPSMYLVEISIFFTK